MKTEKITSSPLVMYEIDDESETSESSQIYNHIPWTLYNHIPWTPKLEVYILTQVESGTNYTKTDWTSLTEKIEQVFKVKITSKYLRERYESHLNPRTIRTNITPEESQQIKKWGEEKISVKVIGRILKRPSRFITNHYISLKKEVHTKIDTVKTEVVWTNIMTSFVTKLITDDADNKLTWKQLTDKVKAQFKLSITPHAVKNDYFATLYPFKVQNELSKEEKQCIRTWREDGKTWDEISRLLKRTSDDLERSYSHSDTKKMSAKKPLRAKRINNPWTKEIDAYITNSITNNKESTKISYPTIAEEIKKTFNSTLHPESVRKRYFNKLDPNLNRTEISPEESQQIFTWVEKNGNRWTELGTILKISSRSIRDHYNKTQVQENTSQPQRQTPPQMTDFSLLNVQEKEFNPDDFLVFDQLSE